MYFLVLFFSLFFSCQIFASLEEVVDPYEKGQFLSKTAISFKLEESALSLPKSESQKDLVRAVVKNDRKLMFYLSENKGLSANEKLFYRLQAFQHVLIYYNEKLDEENENFFIPLFKFTGGNWIRLQGVVWGEGDFLYSMTIPTKKVKKGSVAKLALKYMSYLKEPYYRFLSNKECQMRDEKITFAARGCKGKSDRTPNPRSLRKQKYKGW